MLYSADIYDAIKYTMGDKKVNDIGLYCLKIPPISRHRALCWKNQIYMLVWPWPRYSTRQKSGMAQSHSNHLWPQVLVHLSQKQPNIYSWSGIRKSSYYLVETI